MEQLVEQVTDWRGPQLRLDREQRMVWNIALAGVVSRNGYRYSEVALAEAVSLYEGKPVFLDHAGTASRPQERSARDLIGTIINARYEQQRIRGDIRVLETEAGETFWAMVETPSEAVGMSHVVVVERGPQQDVVDKIRDVVSVDAVMFPATVTFQEAQGYPPVTDTPESLSAIEPELMTDRTPCEVTVLRERLLTLESELQRLRPLELALSSAAVVDRLLREVRAPEGSVTAEFRELLVRIDDAGLRRELLTERVRSWRTAWSKGPQSRLRDESGTRWDDTAILRVLCPRRESVLASV